MSVNRVLLVGNLGKDPEIRFTGSGKAVCKFSLATSEQWKDAQGEKQERVSWHQIIVWGKTGEACGKHLTKGRQVFVEGAIAYRTYDNKDGVKVYVTEIIASQVKFLGGGKGEKRPDATGDPEPPMGGGGGGSHIPDDDDIPFISYHDSYPKPVL